jgi:hypothetical protein
LDGAIVALDYALNLLGWTYADAIGISGGGWTVDLLAALDPRIRRSISVFGSLPFSLRPPGDTGDWEQRQERAWWQTLTSEEYVYALGCVDAGRKRIHYLSNANPGDTVFQVRTVLSDITAMQARIDWLVPIGQHSVVLDTTTAGHWYPVSMSAIGALLD